MMTYKMIFEKYERMGGSEIVSSRFEAPSDKHAILKADPWFDYGCGRYDKEEAKELLKLSEEKLISTLSENNGDGSDFLFYLKNESTGKVLFNEMDVLEEIEGWEEEIEEA